MQIVTTTARLLILILAVSLLSLGASAQSLDVFAGLNALTASQAVQNIPKLSGGLFPSVGINLMLGEDFGIGANVAFRAPQTADSSTAVRPTYYDVNLVVAPIHISRAIIPEIELGAGAENLSAYKGLANCGSTGSCISYASDHLMGHVGLALKMYVTENLFIQPEAHFYFIRNNFQFGAPHAERFGVSLGYTFGGGS